MIAEDIVAYAQLRLVEMTKNDVLEITNRHKVDALLDQRAHAPGTEEGRMASPERDERENYDSNINSVKVSGNIKDRASSFKGLVDLKIEQADLLDSDDLENDQYEGLMRDLGHQRSTERLVKNSAEQYKKAIGS